MQRYPIAPNLEHLELAVRIPAVVMGPAPEKHEKLYSTAFNLSEMVSSAAV
jgi:hypothetical protein